VEQKFPFLDTPALFDNGIQLLEFFGVEPYRQAQLFERAVGALRLQGNGGFRHL
jgi:hypothetical protein